MAKVFLAIGHGITTEGTWDCGCADGVYTEAALMKPIVGASIDILKEHGVYVVTDYPENDMNMVECVASANSYGVDLYVSYHCDYYKAPSGTLPIVHSSSDSGYRAAEKINNRVMSIMGIGTNGIKKRDDYEVTYTNMPAVIFETGSIRADIYKLQQADVYGKAIAIGILDYFGISYKGGDVSADPAPSPGGGTQLNFTSIYDSNNYLEEEYHGFWDGGALYGQEEFNRYFDRIYESGVGVRSDGTMEYEVRRKDSGTVTVAGDSFAIIKGFYRYTPADLDIKVPSGERLDRVIIKWDKLSKVVTAPTLKQGTASKPPEIQRDNNVWEISLAQLVVKSEGVVNVINERTDSDLCGALRPKNLSEFNDWINNLKTTASSQLTSMQNRFDNWLH